MDNQSSNKKEKSNMFRLPKEYKEAYLLEFIKWNYIRKKYLGLRELTLREFIDGYPHP